MWGLEIQLKNSRISFNRATTPASTKTSKEVFYYVATSNTFIDATTMLVSISTSNEVLGFAIALKYFIKATPTSTLASNEALELDEVLGYQ